MQNVPGNQLGGTTEDLSIWLEDIGRKMTLAILRINHSALDTDSTTTPSSLACADPACADPDLLQEKCPKPSYLARAICFPLMQGYSQSYQLYSFISLPRCSSIHCSWMRLKPLNLNKTAAIEDSILSDLGFCNFHRVNSSAPASLSSTSV